MVRCRATSSAMPPEGVPGWCERSQCAEEQETIGIQSTVRLVALFAARLTTPGSDTLGPLG